MIFQYPVSDRLDCNAEQDEWLDRAEKAFSILCRIVWIVTRGAGHPPPRPTSFQYPVSDRLDCNRSYTEQHSRLADLSVSCVGSSGL